MVSSVSCSFLFYNADVVNICNPSDLSLSAISFVDDVNPLALGKSTEETCVVASV
jgi:hypothetical protein